jgi:hypothetical protein
VDGQGWFVRNDPFATVDRSILPCEYRLVVPVDEPVVFLGAVEWLVEGWAEVAL